MTASEHRPLPSRHEIGVVAVTYHPGGDVEARLQKMAAQGGSLVVVDNASATDLRQRLQSTCVERGWTFIQNAENRGVGAAVNQGVSHLASQGFTWALLFDQDSEPAAEMSERQLESLRHHASPHRVAVVGVGFREAGTGRRYRMLRRHPRCGLLFQKAPMHEIDLPDVTVVITSGMLVRVADFMALGGFDERLFVDHVDTDFCLRCVEAGTLVVGSAAAELVHRFGDRQSRSVLGLTVHPTHHSALRHYYIARNRVPMIRRHGLRLPHWLWFELAAAGLWLFRVLAAETQKRAKLVAMGLGTWDGLRGQLGACPPARLAQIKRRE